MQPHTIAAIALSVTTAAGAQTPALIRDIRTAPTNLAWGVRPQGFARLGNQMFVAGTEALWLTDGTASGTVNLGDAIPALANLTPQILQSDTTHAYFFATRRTAGGPLLTPHELWRTDGTAAGTSQLGDAGLIRPYALSVSPSRVFALAPALPWPSGALFTTDGSAPISALRSFPLGVGDELVEFGSSVCFAAGVAAIGIEPWISDGTTNGTTALADINPSGSSDPHDFIVAGNTLYFAADDGQGEALWRSDGTPTGTTIVFRTPVQSLVADGGMLYFFGREPTFGREIWRSDGTPGGTRPLADLNPGRFDGVDDDSELTVDISGVYCTSATPLRREPWHVDPATGVATRLATVPAHDLTPLGGIVFFCGIDAVARCDLWWTDGTPSGTANLTDPRPTGSRYIGPMTPFGGHVLFGGSDGVNGTEIWIADGSPTGTQMVFDHRNPNVITDDSDTRPAYDLFGTALLGADDGTTGTELWRTDGTSTGTSLVGDLMPGPFPSRPESFCTIGATTYFAAAGRVWTTDGTPAGTVDLGLPPSVVGTYGNTESELVPVGDQLFFAGYTGADGRQIWVTDGTPNGTTRLTNFPPILNTQIITDLVAFRDGVAFGADDGTNGLELWVSDGTAVGTRLVADIRPGSFGSRPTAPTVFGDELFFWADDGVHGPELWKSDGTPGGTAMVVDLSPGTVAVQQAERMTVAGNTLYIYAGYNSGLLRSDGTAAGTFPLLNGWIHEWFAFGDKLYFGGPDGELWQSDGTVAGTARLKNLNPGPYSARIRDFVRAGSRRFYFRAFNNGIGYELFASDGTVGGTRLFADINPGSDDSANPILDNPMIVSNGRLIFGADDGRHGFEPHVVHLGATSKRIGQPCGDAQLQLDATDPVLGASFEVRGSGFTAGRALGVFIGPPLTRPIEVGGCTLYFDPSRLGLLIGGTVPNAEWTQPIAMPNLPALDGTVLTLQAMQAPRPAQPGVELSNAVTVSLGR